MFTKIPFRRLVEGWAGGGGGLCGSTAKTPGRQRKLLSNYMEKVSTCDTCYKAVINDQIEGQRVIWPLENGHHPEMDGSVETDKIFPQPKWQPVFFLFFFFFFWS